MEHAKISNGTRVLGERQGYLPLYVRDAIVKFSITDQVTGEVANVEANEITTAWKPSMQELEHLVAGGSILISMVCVTPHPMKVAVGEEFEEGTGVCYGDGNVGLSREQADQWKQMTGAIDKASEKAKSKIIRPGRP